jgi:CheY-like chemotaxis protein
MPDKKRVLIVDDEVAVGHMLAACCDMWGLQPIVATNGPEALRLIEESAPDLVVTDFMMPGMSGHEFTVRARENRAMDNVPVILASSAPEVAAKNSPADVLLPKPFDLDLLEQVIRDWLDSGTRRKS